MAVNASIIVVDDTSTPTLIATGPISGYLYAEDNRQVTIGSDAVSMGTGFPLRPGEPFTFKLDVGEQLYGQSANGPAQLHLVEMAAPGAQYDVTLLPPAQYIGGAGTDAFDTGEFQAVIFFLNVTAAGTGSLALTMSVQNPVTGAWLLYAEWPNLLAGVGDALAVCDPASVQADFDVKAIVRNIRVPRTIRLNIVHSQAMTVWEYSLGATVM